MGVSKHGRYVLMSLALVLAAAFACPGAALAHNEGTGPYTNADCDTCHPAFDGKGGAHGGYASTTDRCSICHTIHDAAGSKDLLPRDTIRDTCAFCHDGTGGAGTYGTIAARGLTPGAAHSVDETNVVPGGDAATGGSAVRVFGGESTRLSCDDCHSPHDANTVGPFFRQRARHTIPATGWEATSHLLKRRPGGSSTTVAEYGSDWCAACHAGRPSGGAPHNHPVDSSATNAAPYYVARVPVLAHQDGGIYPDVNDPAPTSTVVFGELGLKNRGMLMPYPRAAIQQGHAPLCQQCHENTRPVGDLSADGTVGDAREWRYSENGVIAGYEPRFTNFPHETVGEHLLVESGDDLCLNCHPAAALP